MKQKNEWALDQMFAQYSCCRKTNRWPLCVFFGIINSVLINSWIIYKASTSMGDDKKMKRRTYMHNVALKLIKESTKVQPWLKGRGVVSLMGRSHYEDISPVRRRLKGQCEVFI